MAHTPGPWEVKAFSDHQMVGYTQSGIFNPVAQVIEDETYDVRMDMAESEANARLISAAPDLLEALKNYVGRCRCAGTGLYSYNPEVVPEFDCEECKDARAAIAKAEGK